MSMKLSRALLLTVFLMTASVAAKSAASLPLGKIDSQGLTPEQAKQVLIFTLKREGYHLNRRGVFFDGPFLDDKGNPAIPGFANFGLGYTNPKDLAVSSWGLFAVNVSSGEVWEINKCKMYSFPALQSIQHKIRTITKITEADERLQRRGTGCTNQEISVK